MAEQGDAEVYFNDGCLKESSYVYVSAKLKSIDPYEHSFSRMFFHKVPHWKKHDLDFNVVSVCYYAPGNSFHALGASGDIRVTDPNGGTNENILDVGTLGAVKQIRQIGQRLHVCGDQGQVYRRDESGWMHIDHGILDRTISASALDLNGIDGNSEEDIYVVGHHGRILHYNGQSWRDLDSPTNLHLERVRCVRPGEAYVCGNEGTFLKITSQGIEDHSIDLEEHFWGLEVFQGRVYLATLQGLYVFDGKSVEPLDTGLTPSIGGYRLDARDGQLWSFGVDDLAYFDGQSWTRVHHPDNP